MDCRKIYIKCGVSYRDKDDAKKLKIGLFYNKNIGWLISLHNFKKNIDLINENNYILQIKKQNGHVYDSSIGERKYLKEIKEYDYYDYIMVYCIYDDSSNEWKQKKTIYNDKDLKEKEEITLYLF